MKLNDKVAIITGSSKGIGYAIAQRLASEGCNLILNARNKESLQQAVEKIKESFPTQPNIMSCVGDVSKEEDVKKIYDFAIEKFGKIDILINNAGITKDNLILRMKVEDWEKVMDINLKSAFLTSKIFLKSILKTAGSIVNISSIIGEIGNAGQSNYAASKGGMIALTKSLAKEVASRNVTVNAITPGFIKTEMTEKLNENIQKKLIEEIPLKRIAGAEEVAGAVAFLVGDDAKYITGQVIAVNGGLAM